MSMIDNNSPAFGYGAYNEPIPCKVARIKVVGNGMTVGEYNIQFLAEKERKFWKKWEGRTVSILPYYIHCTSCGEKIWRKEQPSEWRKRRRCGRCIKENIKSTKQKKICLYCGTLIIKSEPTLAVICGKCGGAEHCLANLK